MLKVISFATLVALLALLLWGQVTGYVTVPLSAFILILLIGWYLERRFKYAFANSLMLLATVCTLSGVYGFQYELRFSKDRGPEGALRIPGFFDSAPLLLSGLGFAYIAWQARSDVNQTEKLKNESTKLLELKSTSIFDRLGWFRNWKLRRRLRAISLNWAPLSTMPSQPIERSELSEIVRLLEQTESTVSQDNDGSDTTAINVVCVLGEKGSGKTTLFLSLVERLRKDNQLVLPIKADRLETGLKLEDWLAKELRLQEKPIIALSRLARKKPLTRSEALNLFEDLLRIGVAEANPILNEKDLRPGYQPVR